MELSDERFLRRCARQLFQGHWHSTDELVGEKPEAGEKKDLDVSFKSLDVAGLFLLRLRFSVQTQVDASNIAELARPELLCDEGQLSRLGVALNDFHQQRVEQVRSPGDCLVATMAQGGLFDELQQVGSHVAVLTGSQPTGATSKGQLLERIIQWRHFPKERALSMVAIPYGWRTGFRSQVGQYFASVSVLEPHPSDHRQLQATVGLLARNLATWAKAPLLSMANLMSQLVNHTVQAVVTSLPVLQDADQKFYTVLTLRTCQGGWPLLPGKPKAEGHVVELSATNGPFRFWFRPEAKDFSLAAYLRAFLPVIGADIQVFESMNGEPLVPFQAVLQRSQWEAVRLNSRIEYSLSFLGWCVWSMFAGLDCCRPDVKGLPDRDQPDVGPKETEAHAAVLDRILQHSEFIRKTDKSKPHLQQGANPEQLKKLALHISLGEADKAFQQVLPLLQKSPGPREDREPVSVKEAGQFLLDLVKYLDSAKAKEP
ncbi:unnamed protein product [Effrenium voratum]|nr:unnamed protein product [Effrenium voratum]